MLNANQINSVGKMLQNNKNDFQMKKQLKRSNDDETSQSNEPDYEKLLYKRTRSISSLSSNSTILKADPESDTESEDPDVVGDENDDKQLKQETSLFKRNNENCNDDHNNNHGDGDHKGSFWRPY